MRFHATISDYESSRQAVRQVISDARSATAGKIDLAFVFLTSHYYNDADDIIEEIWLELDPQAVVGCGAEGVIGAEREIERRPGISLLAGEANAVQIHPFHITDSDWGRLLTDQKTLRERLGADERTRAIIGFGDPLTTPVKQFLPALDQTCPGAPLIGGMASGARAPGDTLLVRNDRLYRDGFVGVTLGGAIAVETIISQGCRGLGRPMVVTAARQNVIEQLGGRPAFEVFRELVSELPEEQRTFLSKGVLIGLAVSEHRERFGRGDFLIRSVLGMDEADGSIRVADGVRVGQTVQFHARDARTADEDLSLMLDAHRINPAPDGDPPASQPAQHPAGGLLISCNARGTRLFPEPGHDLDCIRRALPETPLAGFFAAGEIGPVAGRNFLHSHTASLALFRPVQD